MLIFFIPLPGMMFHSCVFGRATGCPFGHLHAKREHHATSGLFNHWGVGVTGMSTNKQHSLGVLFIGTHSCNLYTVVDTPAEAAWLCAWCVCVRVTCVFGSSRSFQPLNIRLCPFQHFSFLTSPRAVKTSQYVPSRCSRPHSSSTPAPHRHPAGYPMPPSLGQLLCTSSMTT